MDTNSIFTPKPLPRVQDFKGTNTENIGGVIIGDEDITKEVTPKVQNHGVGTAKLELPKLFYKVGQHVSGRLTIKLNQPSEAESLVVALWGQKMVNVPLSLKNQSEDGTRTVYVSQRSVELCKNRSFGDDEAHFEFELPIVSPVPDIATNYKWYVGASLVLGDHTEVADLVEIKVAD